MNILEIIKSGRGKIVDVRSVEEFAAGHVEGSINIPLPEVTLRVEEFKKLPQPLFLVCASGNRSGMAAMMLQREGLECYNAGGWADLDYHLAAISRS